MASFSASTPEDLENALMESLTQQGVLQKIICELRKQILESLHGRQKKVSPLSKENELINSLFCEYLEYNGFLCTKSVLMTESNHCSPALPRKLLEHELSVYAEGEAESIPLIYSIIFREPEKNENVKKIIHDLVKKSKEKM